MIAYADNVVIVADAWCPYNCEPGSSSPGIFVELAEKAFKSAGHTLEYRVMPWSRAKQEAKEGKLNGIIGAFKEDAPGFIFPEYTPIKAGIDFFAKSGSSWRFNGIKSLDQVSLGVVQDYEYPQELSNYIKVNKNNPKRIQATKGENPMASNIAKLLAGRIDVMVDDGSVIRNYLVEHKLQASIGEVGSYNKDDAYIAFSPALESSKSYAKILSDFSKTFAQTPEFQELLKKYGLI